MKEIQASTIPAEQKTVLLGVTGCIAAYKSAEIVRGLQKAGMRVKVVMTEHACEFVGPTTFRALTGNPVATGLFDAPGDPIHHISLAKEADLFLIAPCTANVIAKIAQGLADDLLTTTALATTAPLVLAPAMNVNMYEAAATQANLAVLAKRGVKIIETAKGYLACGDIGRGKLADVDHIVSVVLEILAIKRDLEGRRVMITAGPTIEAIDPVRCITNHSSGKMGYALARVAARRGASVTLVSGPVSLEVPEAVSIRQVKSAEEMFEAAQTSFTDSDIAVFTAAVCDFRPKTAADKKLKKTEGTGKLSSIELVENPDILATLAADKRKNQVVVGFAAETDNVIEQGKKKLISKYANFIVANQVGEGLVFGHDKSKAYLIDSSGVQDLPLMAKDALAELIFDKAISLIDEAKK